MRWSKRRRLLLELVAIASLALSACSQKPPDTPPKEFSLHGQVLKVDSAGQLVTVKGDKIEGWMDAMTMEYPVKDKNDLAKLKAGETIRAKVLVQGTDYWLAGINEEPAAAPSK